MICLKNENEREISDGVSRKRKNSVNRVSQWRSIDHNAQRRKDMACKLAATDVAGAQRKPKPKLHSTG